MARMLFVNLPVTDLALSSRFFDALGFVVDPAFSDENATCLVINDSACVMLLRRDFFESFHRRGTAHPGAPIELTTAITADSREDVDRLCTLAFEHGGSPVSGPDDRGFMYAWSFADPDGHVWEAMWMDPAAA
jgi:predicted lactoylglutathione lyase